MARRDAEENRTALLDAARLLLNRDPSTSMEAIAATAGLTRRTAYGHFPTRDGLLDALAERGTQRIVDSVAAVDLADPVERLARIAAVVWDDLASIRVMTLLTVSGDRRATVDRGLQPLRRILTDAIAAGAAAGTLRDDMPAERVARLVEDEVVAALPLTLRDALDADAGRMLVVRVALGAAGLGWREQAELLDAHPELVAGPPDPLWPTTGTLDRVRS